MIHVLFVAGGSVGHRGTRVAISSHHYALAPAGLRKKERSLIL